jgi:RNA polymerase sporulation-specific sigma factor
MSQTEELIRLARSGDQDAKETLLTENAGLIWSITKRYFGRGTDAEDLYQLGCLGFLKAVEGFDGGYGTQFSTYAVPKISGEIRRFLRDDGSIKVSRVLKERAFTISVARGKLINVLGREPTISELSEFTGISPEEIVEAETATAATESMQNEIGDDGFSLEKVLADPMTEDALLEQITLQEAIQALPERESLVIKMRYYHGLTQARVASVLKVSQVQVSRIEKKALSRLKDCLKCGY